MHEKDESSTAQEISPLRIIQNCSFGDLSPNECANIFFSGTRSMENMN